MYHWKKGLATWTVNKTLYISVPFTWLVQDARELAARWKRGKVLIGGPGLMVPNDCPGYDPILFHNPLATFTTRGCPNACPFCAVPKLEGDLTEIKHFRPAPVICDNNLLAASKRHIREVVDKIKIYPLVDFNQGLEARRFTPAIADMLGELRCKVRFSFDSWGQESKLKDAVDLCRERSTKDIGIYVLIGYKDNPEDAKAKLELVRSWGLRPNPMRYQPLDAKVKNEYLAPGWTVEELNRITRYYSRLRWLEHIPIEEYTRKKGDQ
jgi:hypothetical protein